MSKNIFVEADSFRRLLLGAAGGYELQGYHEAAQTVMHVILLRPGNCGCEKRPCAG